MDEFHRSLPDSFREAHCLVREALSHADKIIREADRLAREIAPSEEGGTQVPQMTAKRANWLFGGAVIGLEKVLPSALAAFKAIEVSLLRVADPCCEHERALEFAEEVRGAITLTAQLYDHDEVTFANIGRQLTSEWELVWDTLGFVERIDVGQLHKRMKREIARAVSIKVDVPPTHPKATLTHELKNVDDQDDVSALEHEKAVPVAVEMLFGWQEILDVLGRDNERRDRDRIRDLNETTSGPIVFPNLKGGQPQVPKAALVQWWNLQMQAHNDAAKDRRRNDAEIAANLSAEHDYGRSGTVLPEISGSKRSRKVTKRRD